MQRFSGKGTLLTLTFTIYSRLRRNRNAARLRTSKSVQRSRGFFYSRSPARRAGPQSVPSVPRLPAPARAMATCTLRGVNLPKRPAIAAAAEKPACGCTAARNFAHKSRRAYTPLSPDCLHRPCGCGMIQDDTFSRLGQSLQSARFTGVSTYL